MEDTILSLFDLANLRNAFPEDSCGSIYVYYRYKMAQKKIVDFDISLRACIPNSCKRYSGIQINCL